MSGVSLDQLKSDFEIFRDQCHLLIRTRETFDFLYVRDVDTTKILHDTAPWFFEDLHRLLLEAYFLQIGRITDPVKSNNKHNLSCEYIVAELVANGLLDCQICNPCEISELAEKIQTYRGKTNTARNKYIAHLDRNKLRANTPLGKASESDTFEFIGHLNAFSDLVAVKLGLNPDSSLFEQREGDAMELVRILQNATVAKEEQ